MRLLLILLSVLSFVIANDRGLVKINNSESIPIEPFGKYYALIIANQNYKSLPKLNTPYNDAIKIERLLKNKYGFKTKIAKDVTRKELFDIIDEYQSLDKNTNLLIYYAGHGSYDKDEDIGYWQMVDSDSADSSTWVAFYRIKSKFSKKLKSKHILVIADSCYSGGLLANRSTKNQTDVEKKYYYQKLAQDNSRYLLASGGLEPVADGGGDGNSVFAKAFVDTLSNTPKDIFTFSTQVEDIKIKTTGRAKQTPKYDFLQASGHDNGDFIFIKQENNTAIEDIDEDSVFSNEKTTYNLYITTTPSDAQISVDGYKYVYPMKLKKNKSYNVEISKNGYITKKGNILIDKDKRVNVSLDEDETIKYTKAPQATNTTTYTREESSTNDIYKDPTTGLIWQNQFMSQSDKINFDTGKEGGRVWKWENAKKYCSNLNLAGKSWRLPSKDELKSIMTKTIAKTRNGFEYHIKEPLIKNMPPVDGHRKYAVFFTSSEYDGKGGEVWVIYFKLGVDHNNSKSFENYVMCVTN